MADTHNFRMYTDRERVYSGPFCDIYKCTSPAGRTVALKVVDLDFLQKPHNFRREVRFLQRLSHPNVATFIDLFSQGEDHYMVMEYYKFDLNGVFDHFMSKRTKFNLEDPTKNYLVTSNRIPVASVTPMIWALVLALKYIHASGIIHRDIKPANVMFSSLDCLENPVVGDFGISYDVSSPPGDEPPNEKFTDVCSGYYKAPELCFGVTDYGSEIDLWSLGILISALYSKDGNTANFVKSDPSGVDAAPELNDFYLILGIFGAFGTPNIVDEADDLYWKTLANDKCHFAKFNYKSVPRKPTQELLPRCQDREIMDLFEHLTRYCNRQFTTPTKADN